MGARITTLVCSGLVTLLLTGHARADKVHLVDGAVIEGKARRQGDRVVIELDAGEMTLAGREVARIEHAPTALERLAALEAVELQRGVPGWMVLADFCRDHGLRARELALLAKVIERDPEHADARARLGYVRTAEGWVKAEALALERRREEEAVKLAEHARQKAALELEAQKVALERERFELERTRAKDAAREVQAAQAPVVVYGGGSWHHGHHDHCSRPECRRARPARRSEPFPINGVRDPRDPSWRIPGVRDPLERDRRRRR